MATFHPTQPPLAKFRANFLRLAWLTILFLILPILFIVSGAINVKQNPLLIFPFIIIPVGISIYRLILILMNLDLEILLYNDGFQYTHKGKTKRYFWKEIDKVWATKFELMSFIYIKYVRVKILDTSGNTLILDRTLQNIDKFEAIVQEQVARNKFPQAMAMLQQGMSLEFGEIIVTSDYIKNQDDTILWKEFGDLQTWQGSIRLWKKGKQAMSIVVEIPSTPNFALLLYLIGSLSETAKTVVHPIQDTKNEKSVSREKIQQAISLIKSGSEESGQKLLFEIVASDPNNEAAWLWLVSVVPPDQRIFCLEKALRINPNNLQARQHLEKLKASEPKQPLKPKAGVRIRPGGNTDARLSGLLLFVIGAGMGYWQIVLPIIKALQQEPYISYYLEATLLVPFALVIGLFLLVFGSDGLGFLSKPSSKLGIVLLSIVIIISVLICYFGMGFIMKSLGYS